MPRDKLAAHRDDDTAAWDSPLALPPNLIGSKDPHGLKFIARQGGIYPNGKGSLSRSG